MLTAVAMFFLYFKDANARLCGPALTQTETADALRRWAAWHRVRTAISCLAFCGSSVVGIKPDGLPRSIRSDVTGGRSRPR